MTRTSPTLSGSREDGPRGRVLIVGSTNGRTPALPCRSSEVANVLEAIGEVTTAGHRDPIDLVLIDESALTGPAGRAAEAIRRVDPAVKVALLTTAPNGSPEGFDAVIGPSEGHRLLALLSGEDVPPPMPAAPAPTAPTAPTATAPRPERKPGRTPRHMPKHAIPLPPEVETHAEPIERAAPPPGERLGDVDLLDAVRSAPAGVRDAALGLIVQQTEWTDLALLDDEDQPAPRGASVEVREGERLFGRLVTDRASSDEIRPWADWLARWLSLDRAFRDYRLMAFQDELTGAWNRRFFNTFLTETLARARELRRHITVMVFDIDDFKRYNDDFGHEAGDVVLTETVRLLNSVIRQGDRVCRIGGDEFAVIFADLEAPREVGSSHPSVPEKIATRFQDQICRMRFPKLGRDAPGPLSISAGLATYPWDGNTPEDLLHWADQRALLSKKKGKNAITLGPEA